MTRTSNIYQLGIKELWSLRRDPVMMVLIVYTFSVAIYRRYRNAGFSAQGRDRYRG